MNFIVLADMSGTRFIYEHVEHFASLEQLRFLRARDCEHVDDACVAKLAMLLPQLEYLDLSRCPRITERGLAALHSLK